MVPWGLHATYLHFKGERHPNLALVPLVQMRRGKMNMDYKQM